MLITQKPDAISLSANIKSFRIVTAQTETFLLYQGEELLLSRSYSPGADGVIEIDVRDVVHPRLSFLLKEESSVYEQTGIVSGFKAVIGEEEVLFTVIRGGVEGLSEAPEFFLARNFLTWQPTMKPVTYYSPEFLTYFSTDRSTLVLDAYFTNAQGEVVEETQLELFDMEGGKAYTAPLQYAIVAGLLGNRLPAYYDVYVENDNRERLTYIQRYYAAEMRSESEQWVMFENSLGGIDTFRAYGSTDFTGEHTHNVAEIDEVSVEYRVDTQRKYEKNTGYLNKQERAWLLDFFPSLRKYLYDGTRLRPIVVLESDVTYTEEELPSNYSFTYKYAAAKPLLNLHRRQLPAEGINVVVPDVGSFTVPPRLVEFPRLQPSEGALFPVQSPYSENWSSITLGMLCEYVLRHLSGDTEQGAGGTPNLEKIINGVLKEFQAELKETALSRLKDDVAAGLISFLKGAQFGEFVSGLSGALIDEQGNAELHTLKLRDSIVVPKITYNCIDVISGDKANSFAYGTIKLVDREEQIAELDLLESEVGTLRVEDICRGVFHFESGGNTSANRMDDNGFLNYSGFSTAYFTPTRIIVSEPGKFRFRYVLQDGTETHPAPGMKFFAYGNFRDESRQSITYENRYYTRRLKRVDTWNIDPDKNIAMQQGLLEGLTIRGLTMKGYGTYEENSYLDGPVIQFTPQQKEALKGESAYSVTLSTYEAGVTIDADGHIIDPLFREMQVVAGEQEEEVVAEGQNVVTSLPRLSTRIQALKGGKELLYSDTYAPGKFIASIHPSGCVAHLSNGVVHVTEILEEEYVYVSIRVNCEGNASFEKRFNISVLKNGRDGEDGLPGEKGDDGKSASMLVSSITQIRRSSDGTLSPGTFMVRNQTSDGDALLSHLCVWGSNDNLHFTKLVSTESTDIALNVSAHPYSYYSVRSYPPGTEATIDTPFLNSISIVTVADGNNGANGCVFRRHHGFAIGQLYRNDEGVTASELLEAGGVRYIDVVLVPNRVLDSGVDCYFAKKHNGENVWVGTADNDPTRETFVGNESAHWVKANNLAATFIETLITRAAIIDFGQIGAFIYKGDMMFSQQGEDALGNPVSDYGYIGQSHYPTSFGDATVWSKELEDVSVFATSWTLGQLTMNSSGKILGSPEGGVPAMRVKVSNLSDQRRDGWRLRYAYTDTTENPSEIFIEGDGVYEFPETSRQTETAFYLSAPGLESGGYDEFIPPLTVEIIPYSFEPNMMINGKTGELHALRGKWRMRPVEEYEDVPIRENNKNIALDLARNIQYHLILYGSSNNSCTIPKANRTFIGMSFALKVSTAPIVPAGTYVDIQIENSETVFWRGEAVERIRLHGHGFLQLKCLPNTKPPTSLNPSVMAATWYIMNPADFVRAPGQNGVITEAWQTS